MTARITKGADGALQVANNNNGYASGSSTAFVLNVDVNFFDDDADGVADDFDNCEFEPNTKSARVAFLTSSPDDLSLPL